MCTARALRASSVVAATVASLGVAALALPACVREGPVVVAPVEVTIGAGDGGAPPPLVVVAPPPRSRDRCTALLRALPIKTADGCTLDERISHGDGTLIYPCSGEGPVEAVFGEHHFQGAASESALALSLATELDWDDGCHWETKQTIRGEWTRDAGRRRLAWSYTEAPVRGARCFASCRATADIEVDAAPP